MFAQDRGTYPKKPAHTIIVGGSWGDEGKGKLVDKRAENADAVVRFSGANNAGHTIIGPQGKFVGHLLPCGIAQHKTCILTRGVLMNLRALLDEIQTAKNALGDLPPIFIDADSPIWTPWHPQVECWMEFINHFGTTGKAVAQIQAFHDLRISLIVDDIFLPADELVRKLRKMYDCIAPLLFAAQREDLFQSDIESPEKVAEMLLDLADDIKPLVTDIRLMLLDLINDGKRLLFEGAQAALLDSVWGTYPDISSGKSTALGIPHCTGVPLNLADTETIVVFKLFPTRVGGGWMGSEMSTRAAADQFAKDHKNLFDTENPERIHFLTESLEKINLGIASREDLSRYIQVLGYELGATTQRGRSPGFPDAALARYAASINGATTLGLMRLDMGSGLKTIPMITGYRQFGEVIRPERISLRHYKDLEPIIEEFPGWKENISGCKEWNELPQLARYWVSCFEKIAGTEVKYIGTGPERDALIVR